MDTSETIHTLKITTQLTGSDTYPLWKRQMELALSAKRRLGYVTGKIPKPKEDEDKIEAWIVNNNQVITWILQNVSEMIKMVIIYTPTAKGVWDTLEKRYTNGRSVEEYYTQLQVIWDELESMSSLPTLSKVTTEIAEYLTAVDKQAEERRLFQFLNGLDKQYGMLRSNMLMMDPLPTVEHTVSLVLQEEMQSNNLGHTKQQEHSALMSRGEIEREKCVHCGRDNYKSELCWEVKGYPVGHPKHRKTTYKPGVRGEFAPGFKQQKSHQNNFRQQTYRKSAASAKAESTDLSTAIGGNTNKTRGESEGELECNYAGMLNSCCQTIVNNDWIIDSGATNHMTAQLETLENVKELSKGLKINLPDGRSVQVTYKGEIMLNNGLRLKGVLYVPEFKENLMSVQKLAKENECYITFFDSHCYVQGCSEGEIKGIGKEDNGLYCYKIYKTQEDSDARKSVFTNCKLKERCEAVKKSKVACNGNFIINENTVDDSTLWHNRLGHAPWPKIKRVVHLQPIEGSKCICLTCPMAKFVKSPYSHSQTTVKDPFDLIHIDIWGPYRVTSKGKFRYFLTVVDEKSRGTWIMVLLTQIL
ncbi:hypothetical protein RND81_06G158300 [Saponaria officinalis]|uniref:Retrovirus-related Pol polyprotein from transposon TNT 1-94-like beta-barrel domain-containing protein n=1 Tax=Saponaria officinalis TaxID=3572 RepID=A0AAW1KC47_SAPOF